MTHDTDTDTAPTGRGPDNRSGPAPWATATLVLTLTAAASLWWMGRASEARRVATRLDEYAEAPLPGRETPVDTVLAGLGAEIFQARCAGCHNIHGEAKLGPNLAAVTLRRDFAWIRDMILAPDSMTRFDPSARALREAYGVQMFVAGQLGRPHALALIEFLRRVDASAGTD